MAALIAASSDQAHHDIVMTGVSLDFGGDKLFADLDFTLRAGGWTCILGPSGVGKTSLLRMLAGLEQMQAPARIAWGAANALGRDGALGRNIAYMAQDDLLLPWLDVAGNIALGKKLRREALAQGEIDAMLERIGLGDYGPRLPASLSSGQRQRVALARTLMEDRPVVLMDEPFSALDTISRSRLQDLAAELLAGRTVLLVTHDPLEALRLGDRIHVMSGRPALLGAALSPEGAPPRPVTDPATLRLQGRLLAQLAAAARSPRDEQR